MVQSKSKRGKDMNALNWVQSGLPVTNNNAIECLSPSFLSAGNCRTVCVECLLQAKFHYAIQVTDLVADLVSDLSQTGSSYLDMSR